MTIIRNVLHFFLLGLIISSCAVVDTGVRNFNADWEFIRLDSADQGTSLTELATRKWEPVSLPHTANIEPLVVNNQWQGISWYRKSFEIDFAPGSQKVIVELEAAMNRSVIWLNGLEIATHRGGYLPVVLDLTNKVKKGTNILAIRLDNTDNPLTGPKPLKILDFNTYGGLYRNAWLTIKEKVYLSHPVLADIPAGGGVFIRTPVVDVEESLINVKAHVVNEHERSVEAEIKHEISFNGEVVKEFGEVRKIEASSDFEFDSDLIVTEAKLWSPEHPNLYSMKTMVLVDGEQVDMQTTPFGIRKFEFVDNQLFINGVKTHLRGVNRHQDYPFIGYALSDNAQYRDAQKIKDSGFNFIRLSHYPQSPAFMDACDELGIVVFDAILGWQFYNDDQQFREYCYTSTKNLIKRDRNHPSVLAWETSLNETQMPIPFMEKMHLIVHQEYPGENVYSCGWKPEVYDIYLQARQHRLKHHYDSIHTKPYEVSEYGDWEYYSTNKGLNQHQYSREKRIELSSRQHRGLGEQRLLTQAKNVQESHNDNFDTPAFGDSYWVMYDYNRGYHDEIEYSGLMDIFRVPKFASDFYKSQKNPEEQVILEIASWWMEESSLDVRVYSNCDEVELFLNTQSLGRQKPNNDSISYNLEHPPFTFSLDRFVEGTLKAIGYINEEAVAEDIVSSASAAAYLKFELDESGIAPESGVNDVVFVHVLALDEHGNVDRTYVGEAELEITGSATLVDLNPAIFQAGVASTLIKIGDTPGTVEISAKSGTLNQTFTFETK